MSAGRWRSCPGASLTRSEARRQIELPQPPLLRPVQRMDVIHFDDRVAEQIHADSGSQTAHAAALGGSVARISLRHGAHRVRKTAGIHRLTGATDGLEIHFVTANLHEHEMEVLVKALGREG